MGFRIGDKVRLKGGDYSPGMIVNKVEVKPDHVECKWYLSKEGKFKKDIFHKDTLELDTGRSAAVGRKTLEGP